MTSPSRVLVVAPHPDDAESGCGGTVARWAAEGAGVVIVMCTNGDKGSSDPETIPERLAAMREVEQLDAARLLGVKDVVFLRHPDGSLEDNLQFRGEVVREIRRHKPEVVMCIDPFRARTHTHLDHRVSGQVAIDAACTYAWRPHYFPKHLKDEGLRPHSIREIYLWSSEDPDIYVDISDSVELKVQALLAHASQFPDPQRRGQGVRDHAAQVGRQIEMPFAEGFRVMKFVPDRALVG